MNDMMNSTFLPNHNPKGDLYSTGPDRQLYSQTLTLMPDAVCTIFKMVFGMTQTGREPATYRMRGRQAQSLGHPEKKIHKVVLETVPSLY